MNKQLPRWDLTPIFPSFESDEFTRALERLERFIGEFLAGGVCRFTEAKQLEDRFAAYDTLQMEYYSLYSYPQLILTTDTSNPEALKGLQQVTRYQADMTKCKVLFAEELAATMTCAPDEKKSSGNVAEPSPNLEALISQSPVLEKLRFNLLEMAESVKHQMSMDSEDLAADLAQSGADAWERLQEVLTSQESIVWDNEPANGAVDTAATKTAEGATIKPATGAADTATKPAETKTIIELRSMAIHPDPRVRKKAYEKELELSHRYARPMAMALNSIKQWNLSLNKRRNYSSYLEPSLKASRLDEPVLKTLIGVLEEFQPQLRRYLQAKAKLLGKEQLPFYDLFAPVGSFSESWSWERACNFVKEQYARFYPAMGEFVQHALDNRWVDAPIVKGKVGGAFCWPLPKEQISRVLVNFDGYFGDVLTLAHELGHAYHSWVMRDLPAEQQEYPMPLAETASIFGETLVLEGAVEALPENEQLLVLDESLTGYAQILMDILSRYYFEESLFKRRADGELAPEELCDLMKDAQIRTYGNGLDPNYLHPYMWFNKGHYYSADLPFYNYPYAFGGLFSLGVYAKAKEHGAGFGQTYDRLLRETGVASTVDVAKVVGIDITGGDFWQSSLQLVQAQIDRYVKLAAPAGEG